jgi:hypothetical protein
MCLHCLIGILIGALLHFNGMIVCDRRYLPESGFSRRQVGGGCRDRADGKNNNTRAKFAS